MPSSRSRTLTGRVAPVFFFIDAFLPPFAFILSLEVSLFRVPLLPFPAFGLILRPRESPSRFLYDDLAVSPTVLIHLPHFFLNNDLSSKKEGRTGQMTPYNAQIMYSKALFLLPMLILMA